MKVFLELGCGKVSGIDALRARVRSGLTPIVSWNSYRT